jgi:glycogen synthase
MHVLITADTVGGVWTYTQDLVGALATRGIRITLVSFGAMPTSEQTEWLKALPEVDYRPTSFRLEWMQDAAVDVERSRRYLQELIRGVRPNLLHSNQLCYGSVKADIPRIVVAHSDVVSWWQSVHGTEPPEEEWRWYRSEVRNGLWSADLVVAPSQWMMSTLVDNYDFNTETRVIYNGRDVALFKSSSTRSNYALSVGRVWDRGKQLDLLLNQNLDIPVYIAGPNEDPGKNTRITGFASQSELRGFYSRAAIYVATSRYEPFGLAPVEAALSGCALVLNDIPVFRELWHDCAVYFEQNNATALARAVSDLSINESKRQEFADRAQSRAREKFSASRMANEYCAIYEQVLAREQVA